MKKQNQKISLYFLIIFIIIFVYCKFSCDKNKPFRYQGDCVEGCSLENLNNGLCVVENEIIKTQWINNINFIAGNGFNYINLAVSENNNLFALVSAFPQSNDRIVFGITSTGQGYFSSKNIEKFVINDPNKIGKFESEIFFIKLYKLTNTKEYLMSYGRNPQFGEIYDLENKKIYFGNISSMFYDMYAMSQKQGAYFKLTTSDYNYYLIGVLSVKYRLSVGTPILSLIKFRVEALKGTSITIKTPKSKEVKAYASKYVSCYELPSKYIICFYTNENNKYIAQAFTSELEPKTTNQIGSGDKNVDKFYKCAHFNGDSGAFFYFNNDNPPKPYIVFRSYVPDKISISFSTISFGDHYFFYNYTMSDIIKVKDKKIFLVAISLDKIKLYVVSIFNYNKNYLIKRMYEIYGFIHNEYYFYNIMKIIIYNKFLVFGSNGFVRNGTSFSALTIFSYPNNIDTNIELSDYLLNNNDIKINNIKLKVQDLCIIDNNIFGLILTGIKIIDIQESSYAYLSIINGEKIKKDGFLDIEDILILVIQKTSNYYPIFSYEMKYVCQATEPEYNKYNELTVAIDDTGNSENAFFDSNKQTYEGRYINYKVLLNNKLTDEDCVEQCELCYNSNKNNCITCTLGFDLIDGKKICDKEIITTFIETTLPEIITTSIETTLPEIKTLPVEITLPEIITTSIETTFPKIITTSIETTFPKTITTVPKPEETDKIKEPIQHNCTSKEIIKGICKGDLTDEMGEDIYLYIKYELINYNLTEENILIKTPSIAFQLTKLDYQKKNNLNISIVDLGICEDKLKEVNKIPKEYDLIIFKVNIQNQEDSLIYVQYEVYNPLTFEQLSLDDCKDLTINITIPATLDSETLNIYKDLKKEGYNLFDENGDFYNDICTPYTINNTDILLIDRKTDIYSKYNNKTICQNNCHLEAYNEDSSTASCFCNIQLNDTKIELNIHPKFDFQKVRQVFFNYLNNSNFRVLQCYTIAIDLKTIFNNIGRIIMTLIFLIFIILFIIFLIKGNKQIKIFLEMVIKSKLFNNKSNTKPKNQMESKAKKMDLKLKSKFNTKKKNDINKKANKKVDKKTNKKNKDTKVKSNPIKNKKNLKIKNKKINKKYSKKNKNFSNSSNNNKLIEQNTLIDQINSKKKLKAKKKNENKNNNIIVYNILNNYNKSKKDIEKITKIDKVPSNKLTLQLNDQELNTLIYKKAIIFDKRTYFQYYCSLLKKKHLILFAFLPINDYNLPYIKIILFLISFSLFFCINGFFYSDSTIHKVYTDNGVVYYLSQIVPIIFSSIIPAIINITLKLLSLSENDIINLKKQNRKISLKEGKLILNCLKIKFIIFFIISFLLLSFCWYFISCFCGVFKNTQIILIIDTLISFGFSMIYPFGLYLLPGMFRIPALRKKDKKCLYQFSTLVALI